MCVCVCVLNTSGWQTLKFVASQAKTIDPYNNTRSKLLKCCANIYFNKQCFVKKVIPKYANLIFTKCKRLGSHSAFV